MEDLRELIFVMEIFVNIKCMLQKNRCIPCTVWYSSFDYPQATSFQLACALRAEKNTVLIETVYRYFCREKRIYNYPQLRNHAINLC